MNTIRNQKRQLDRTTMLVWTVDMGLGLTATPKLPYKVR